MNVHVQKAFMEILMKFVRFATVLNVNANHLTL